MFLYVKNDKWIFIHKPRKSFGELVMKCLCVETEPDFDCFFFCGRGGGGKLKNPEKNFQNKDEINPPYNAWFRIRPRDILLYIRWKASVHTTTPFPLPNIIHAKERTLALIREKCLHPVIGLTVVTEYLTNPWNHFRKNVKPFEKPHDNSRATCFVTSFICFRFAPKWNLWGFYVFWWFLSL